MSTTSTQCPFGPDWDFTGPDVLANGIPAEEFAHLRDTSPVWWNPQPPGSTPFDDAGYWVLTRHADIRAVSKDPSLWSSNLQGAVVRLPDGTPPEALQLTKALLINQDPPSHTKLRRVIARLFTPRAVAQLHDNLTLVARQIVDKAVDRGSGNFVDDIAVDLPLTAILDLIGVPAIDRPRLFELSNAVLNTDDPDFALDIEPVQANAEILGYAHAMAEERRKSPTDDIVSTLVHADLDGEAIDPVEFGFCVLLLIVAGNETTRNAITSGMNALLDTPDQWELYKRERPATTADEIVRWATPVNVFQRTATADTTIGDTAIAKGERVGLFYGSANYDDTVFDHPFDFNIERNPNPHLGFGGNGPHFCMGANLAKMEIDIMMNAIADRIPNITKNNEPTRVRGSWINGIKNLHVDYSPRG